MSVANKHYLENCIISSPFTSSDRFNDTIKNENKKDT